MFKHTVQIEWCFCLFHVLIRMITISLSLHTDLVFLSAAMFYLFTGRGSSSDKLVWVGQPCVLSNSLQVLMSNQRLPIDYEPLKWKVRSPDHLGSGEPAIKAFRLLAFSGVWLATPATLGLMEGKKKADVICAQV